MATRTKKHIYSAEEVAKYLIYLGSQVVGDSHEREGVTNLKLQKLLYFAQAYYVSKIGRPLFADKIEAWEYGPVVPGVYQKYKSGKSAPIILEKDESTLAPADKEILKKVWETFGGYSARRLVDIAHAHTPWKNAYSSNSAKKEITVKSLADYYAPLLNK